MERFDAAGLAERAGAEPDDLERMVALGILASPEDGDYGEADIVRARLCLACERAGLSLEHIAGAIEGGHLSLSFLDTGFMGAPAHGETTFAEACARAGVRLEFLQRAYEALEFVRPEADVRVREDDRVVIDLCAAGIASGISDEVALRGYRTYGENLRRISESIQQLYHSNIELPLLASGMSETQMREIATGASLLLRPLTDRLVMSVYQRHLERYIIADIVDHIESALESTGLHRRRATDPPAMAFVDLAGYTRLTEERGDHAAAELAGAMSEVVRDTVTHHGGRAVKWLGDGVMLHFPEPGPGVVACLELVEALPGAGLPDGHAGVSAGPVVTQDGDFYGRTVNLAARISSKAGPGEVLVNEDVVTVATAAGVSFEQLGSFELKGFADPVVLHRAGRA